MPYPRILESLDQYRSGYHSLQKMQHRKLMLLDSLILWNGTLRSVFEIRSRGKPAF